MSVSSSTFTCADFNKLLSSFGDAKDEDIPILRPNPDISGLGVLIGFLATAYLTLLAVVVYYFMGFVPKSFINAVDRGILWHKASPEIARLLEPTLRRGVLMFSDQQVVTGIAILASGYAQLRYNISVYHWQIVVYLAWFSSLTHLTTLTMMRQYFRENPTPRLWRATLMLVTVILLTVALIPTGDGWWLTLDGLEGLPAICFFKRLVIRDPQERFQALPLPTAYMIISVMILFISCSTRMIKLSARATDCIRCWTRTKLGNIIKRALRASIKRAALPNVQLRWKLERVGLETLYVLLRAWTDVFESMLWEIFWLGFAMAWGTVSLIQTRNRFHPVTVSQSQGSSNSSREWISELSDEENTWGFGQVLPLILLMLPILGILENYYGTKRLVQYDDDNHEGQNQQVVSLDQETNMSHSSLSIIRVGQWTSNRTSLSGLDMIASSSSPTDDHFDQAIEDYYIFEWFWVLVAMVLWLSFTVAILLVIMFASLRFDSSTASLELLLMVAAAPFAVLSTAVYALILVFLKQFHAEIGGFIQKYVGCSRKSQRKCLSFYVYWHLIVCWIVLVAIVSIPFSLSNPNLDGATQYLG